MLLIWDIHINSRFKNKIIDNIRNFVDRNNDQKNIVFLWDYVYHFSYDRNALLWLFEYFLELYNRWKNIYILAWNHDRISEIFVFEEWKRFSEILKWNIYFITQPWLTEIEWEKILFMPFNININYTHKLDEKLNLWLNELIDSNNKNEQISYKINSVLLDYINNNWKDKIIVIHHYYFANTIFTWQKSRFNYKDIALSDIFLNNYKNVYFISWHLHQWFVYKNYFCSWSVWNTSPLEINQTKFLYVFDPDKLSIIWENININNHLLIEHNDILDNSRLNFIIQNIYNQNLRNFEWWWFDVKFNDFNMPSLSDINLSIKVKDIDYDNINNIIDNDLMKWLKDIKLKKDMPQINDVINALDISSKDLESNISDWKNLLKEYLIKKFWTDSDKYIDKLKEMGI